MSKFKVGQKVTVRRDLTEGESYESEGARDSVTREMMDLVGQTVTIQDVTYNKYHIVESSWNWTSSMFEEYSGESVDTEFDAGECEGYAFRSFNLLDVYDKNPCHDEFRTLMKEWSELGLYCYDDWDSDMDDIEDFPTLRNNLDWLEKHGFCKKIVAKPVTELKIGDTLKYLGELYTWQAIGDCTYILTSANQSGRFTSVGGKTQFDKDTTLEDLQDLSASITLVD